ncbi:MAG: hypothetical protein OXI01_23810 [Albidovulum sp.]|nr:hypothetical protein [Albidovulum sp.]
MKGENKNVENQEVDWEELDKMAKMVARNLMKQKPSKPKTKDKPLEDWLV